MQNGEDPFDEVVKWGKRLRASSNIDLGGKALSNEPSLEFRRC